MSGKMNVRRRQYTKAMEGDNTQLIWLGKNLLGQTDQPDVEAKDLPPIVIERASE